MGQSLSQPACCTSLQLAHWRPSGSEAMQSLVWCSPAHVPHVLWLLLHSLVKWEPVKDWHFMQCGGLGSSLHVGHLFPRMIRQFWMIWLAPPGLQKLKMVWAQHWLGEHHSTGLIQWAEQMDPVRRLFLLSMSLCMLGFSSSRVIGTYLTSMENGLEVSKLVLLQSY